MKLPSIFENLHLNHFPHELVVIHLCSGPLFLRPQFTLLCTRECCALPWTMRDTHTNEHCVWHLRVQGDSMLCTSQCRVAVVGTGSYAD